MSTESEKDKEKEKEKEKEKKQKEWFFADTIKRVISVGVGAAFLTEDSIKNLLGDVPLPKDILNGLLQNAKTAKSDFISSVQKELREHLKMADLRQVFLEALEDYEVEVQAKFSFRKKSSGELSEESLHTAISSPNSFKKKNKTNS